MNSLKKKILGCDLWERNYIRFQDDRVSIRPLKQSACGALDLIKNLACSACFSLQNLA